MLSPMIFVLCMDWVMTRVVVGGDTRLKWLRGLNFADNIALVDSTWKGLEVLILRRQEEMA